MADVLGFFKKIMPFVTTGLSLAGPPGVLASSILGKVFNIANPTPDSVKQALSNANMTPELQAQLVEAELTYKQQMQAMGFQHEDDIVKAMDADRANARAMQVSTRSYLPAVLAILAVTTLGFCIYMVGFHNLPVTGKDAMEILLGVVAGISKDVYGYYFGSSAGSDRKTEIIAQNGH